MNEALPLKVDHDRRLRALDDFLEAHEAEHGAITQGEIDQAVRRARSRATVVRPAPGKKARSKGGVAFQAAYGHVSRSSVSRANLRTSSHCSPSRVASSST